MSKRINMAQSPRRRGISQDEKDALYEKYSGAKSLDTFKKELGKLAAAVKNLGKLAFAAGSLGKGEVLRFDLPEGDGTLDLSRAQIRSGFTKAAGEIVKLIYWRRYAKAKRAKPRPEDFKGIYNPVELGDSLINYFSMEGELQTVDGQDLRGNIATALGQNDITGNRGIAMRATVDTLLYIAVFAQGMQKTLGDRQIIHPSDAMVQAFAGSPSLYRYEYVRDAKPVVVEQGPGEPLTTFQVLAMDPAEDVEDRNGQPTKFRVVGGVVQPFKLYYLKRVTALNLKTAGTADDDSETRVGLFNNARVREFMLQEFKDIDAARQDWKVELARVRAPEVEARKQARREEQARKRAAAAAARQ